MAPLLPSKLYFKLDECLNWDKLSILKLTYINYTIDHDFCLQQSMLIGHIYKD
jgi:hypothetical protein